MYKINIKILLTAFFVLLFLSKNSLAEFIYVSPHNLSIGISGDFVGKISSSYSIRDTKYLESTTASETVQEIYPITNINNSNMKIEVAYLYALQDTTGEVFRMGAEFSYASSTTKNMKEGVLLGKNLEGAEFLFNIPTVYAFTLLGEYDILSNVAYNIFVLAKLGVAINSTEMTMNVYEKSNIAGQPTKTSSKGTSTIPSIAWGLGIGASYNINNNMALAFKLVYNDYGGFNINAKNTYNLDLPTGSQPNNPPIELKATASTGGYLSPSFLLIYKFGKMK
jgi:opacity protein-like surface antigen